MLKNDFPPIKVAITTVLLLTLSINLRSQQIDYGYRDGNLPAHQRVDILLPQMSLEEKVGQLRQCNLSSEVENGKFKAGAFQRIFGTAGAGTLESPFFYTEDIARIYNQAQKYLIEETRLGIPG